MPIFEFACQDCGHGFEEILPADAACPECPACGSGQTTRQISMPGPLRKGAFPFKIGPVHPMAQKMAQGLNAGCGGACPGSGCSNTQ